MGISLGGFISQFASSPALAVITLLTLGVILVNGWTDAPNAITTVISTRVQSEKHESRRDSCFYSPGL